MAEQLADVPLNFIIVADESIVLSTDIHNAFLLCELKFFRSRKRQKKPPAPHKSGQ